MSTNQTFRTRFTPHVRTTYDEKSKGRTQQQHADECNINSIMRKFQKTGQLPDLIKKNPQFGDFSNPLDFQQAQNLVILANQQFAALSSHARERFNNSPQKFLEFTANPANAEEMAKLGLMKPEATQRVENAKKSLKSDKTKEPAAPQQAKTEQSTT